MIVSTTEIKSFLGITSTEYDNQIYAYIPMVVQEFFDYTRNYFENNAVKLSYSGITASSSSRSLVMDASNFSTYGFAVGDTIRIKNTRRNDGFYNVESITGATMIIYGSTVYAATNTLRDELTNESNWIITSMNVPPSVKPIFAQMVKFKIDNPMGLPQSESLGDYSVNYGQNSGGGGYTAGISGAMNKYRLVGFV